jgi:hypothetical protein
MYPCISMLWNDLLCEISPICPSQIKGQRLARSRDMAGMSGSIIFMSKISTKIDFSDATFPNNHSQPPVSCANSNLNQFRI